MADTEPIEELLDRIRQKRRAMTKFLTVARPRKRRLLNTTIVAGPLAAALTAAPAVGGQSFTAWLSSVLELAAPSWRILCATATVCSVMATVATQLLKSHNIEENVARALGCRAKLEVLDTALTLGHLDVAEATAEYLKCVEDAAFLDAS